MTPPAPTLGDLHGAFPFSPNHSEPPAMPRRFLSTRRRLGPLNPGAPSVAPVLEAVILKAQVRGRHGGGSDARPAPALCKVLLGPSPDIQAMVKELPSLREAQRQTREFFARGRGRLQPVARLP